MILGLPLRRQRPRRLSLGGKSKVSGLEKRSRGAEKNKKGVGKNRLRVRKNGGGVKEKRFGGWNKTTVQGWKTWIQKDVKGWKKYV